MAKNKDAQIKVITFTGFIPRTQLQVRDASELKFVNKSGSQPQIKFPNGSIVTLDIAGDPFSVLELKTNEGYVFNLDLEIINADNLITIQVIEK